MGQAVCWWVQRFLVLGQLCPAAFAVCVPRNLGVVFMVENEDLPKGLKADVDVELVRAEQCWQNSASKENLVLIVYSLLS